MDEVTCRIVRPKTLSYQSIIEKGIHKEKITTIFKPNTFVDVEFYVWNDKKSLNDNDKYFGRHKQKAKVCLTKVSSDDQDNEANGSSLPKYHISIFKTILEDANEKSSPTSQINFLNFLINQDYMVNPTFVEITPDMGCPYHITLKVGE